MTRTQLAMTLAAAVLAASLGAGATVASLHPKGLFLEMKNGSRVRTLHKTSVYIVDRGVLRHVHYAAYKKLWPSWHGISYVTEVPATTVGEPLTAGTRLVRVEGERAVWLIDSGRTRRWVPDFRPFKFDWNRVETIEPDELERYPPGPDVR